MLLTGDSRRWTHPRPQVWRERWGNPHHPDARLRAELLVEEERGPTVLTRSWGADDGLDSGRVEVQPHGKPKGSLEILGWGDALTV